MYLYNLFEKLIQFQKNDNTKIVIYNFLLLVVLKLLTIVLTILLFPEYIHFFGNNEIVGVWFTVLSVLNWILIFDLGIGNGLRNKLPSLLINGKYDEAKKYISTAYIATTFFSLLLSLVLLNLIPFINWNSVFNIDESLVKRKLLVAVVYLVFIGIIIQFVLKLISSILLALQKAFLANFLGFLSNLIIFVVLKIIPEGPLDDKLLEVSVLNIVAANMPLAIYSIFIFSGKLKKLRPSLYLFDFKFCRSIFSTGLTLLWLQIAILIISNANEFLIGILTSPRFVIDYQAYYKVYNLGALVFGLALTPVWSSVTKSQAEKNYTWIIKVYKFFLCSCAICATLEFSITFFVQDIFDIWLGKGVMEFKFYYGVVFSISGSLLVLHNINTSIGNGLSYFKFQLIAMNVAAIIYIPLSYFFVDLTNSWIGVIVASSVSLMFYEFFAPFFTLRYIHKLQEA